MITKKDREILEGATPGPWKKLNGTDIFTELGAKDRGGRRAPDNDGFQIASTGMDDRLEHSEQVNNAKYVAHFAPSRMCEIFDYIEVLETKNEDMKNRKR